MNEQFKLRNLWIAILGLLLLNIGTLAWIFFKRPAEPPIGPVFIEKALSFDKQQIETFEPLRKRHFDTVVPLRESIKKNKDSLFAWVKSEQADSVEFERRLLILTLKITENERNTFKHFKEIRNLCNPAQKKIFDNVLIQKFIQQGQNDRGRPPGPPQ